MRISPPERRRAAALLALLCLCAAAGLASCRRANLPAKTSAEYTRAVRAFYVGLSALQVGDDVRAEERLGEATRLAPEEPAAWANLGLLYLRQRQYDPAAQNLERARSLAPDNSGLHVLLGQLEVSRGDSAAAIRHFRRATELDARNLKALYALASEVEREGAGGAGEAGGAAGAGDAGGGEEEVLRLLGRILEVQPENLSVQLDVARLAAKRGDAELFRRSMSRLAAQSGAWPPEAKDQLKAVEAAAAGGDTRAAAPRVQFLRNVLVRLPEYRESRLAVQDPPEILSEPLTRFVRLESPSPRPAPADEGLTYEVSAEPRRPAAGAWAWAGAVSLTGEGAPSVLLVGGREALLVDGRAAQGASGAAQGAGGAGQGAGGAARVAEGKSRVAEGAALSFPGGASSAEPSPVGVAALDFDYDFKTDLALAGEGGFRLYRQQDGSSFADVTARTKLPDAVTAAPYAGAWAADVEADGDLDLLLAARAGAPLVLRNNGDGTFAELRPFDGASAARDFAWADFDGDGDPDAGVVEESGRLLFFTNERGGQFRARPLPPDAAQTVAVGAADLNGDGLFDLVALGRGGRLLRFSDRAEGREWEQAEVLRAGEDLAGLAPGRARLAAADLDNNGGIDLLLSTAAGARAWLSDEAGNFRALGLPDAAARSLSLSVADADADGRLDLVGVGTDGGAFRARARGTKNYHWQVIRPRAANATGDQRINSFGVGGEMEIRAGLLVQKQQIAGPVVHFGLGEQAGADVVRVVWPNGSVRAEFELGADQAVLAEQRLKGSCPSLFAFDGRAMSFVKDCAPWSPAIGLRINNYQTARVSQTEEWVKIGGGQLAPREGFYDLRITAELWETYYLDRYALAVVDHPAGTEVFVDERTARAAPALKVYVVETPRRVARAWDDSGADVTEVVARRDGRHLDTFGRGRYQGVTRDHFVELDLGDASNSHGASKSNDPNQSNGTNDPDKSNDPNESHGSVESVNSGDSGDSAAGGGPAWLIAHGWLHPTDASINVAVSQGAHPPPKGLSLEVADGRGGWRVARPDLGFPAGKNKTILVDLAGVFRPGEPRRVRLRTNMEIYWDAIEWARGADEAAARVERLEPSAAELRYRGFSEMRRAGDSAPETPAYERVAATAQIWRDLVGYYTRFGDVRELLAHTDDRVVIANAGDELRLRFPAPPAPPAGFARDYVLVGNGWIKDGDYNSMFSKTVLPLPSRDRDDYATLPARLEDDPVYRRHPADWQNYHTRYVTPRAFGGALRTK